MIATIVLASVLGSPCFPPVYPQPKHHKKHIVAAPLQSCVLPPALAADPPIDPVQPLSWPKYIIIETASPCTARDWEPVEPDYLAPSGVRARAPEIDPSSAGSGLTLLFGALAVIRARRHG